MKSTVHEYKIFELEYANVDHFYQILVTMNDKKARDCDGIPCKLLKIGAFPLAEILCNLINMSIDECVFPGLLKFAEICALFKKLDRLCKENYRPLSILTALSKGFERNHANQISSFLEKYSRNFCQDFVKDTVVKPHSWEWFKTVNLPLIMAILLDQLQLISAKLLTVCPMGYSRPNSMHMVSNCLHVSIMQLSK